MGDGVPESVPKALEEGYRPETAGRVPEDAEWSDYGWALVPCPHCDTGMLIGVHDPEYKFEDEPAALAIMAPGKDNESQ